MDAYKSNYFFFLQILCNKAENDPKKIQPERDETFLRHI